MIEVIDIRTIIEDIIKVSLKTRKKNPKERNMIDVGKVTLPASKKLKKKKKGMVKEMKEMFERQNNETLCRKRKEDVGKVIRKDMLKENSTLKESLRSKLDTKDEIGKVNKGRKNNNDNLKEKANSDSVV